MNVKFEFGSIQISSIDTSSGIFISQTNVANGWRAQTKSNSGFGDLGDHNKIENCIFFVSDDDVIDSPMEDNSILIENNTASGDTAIHFKEVKVDSLNQNAAISIGKNTQSGWSSPTKNNEGNGEIYGDTYFAYNQLFIKDNDVVDAPIKDYHIVNNRYVSNKE